MNEILVETLTTGHCQITGSNASVAARILGVPRSEVKLTPGGEKVLTFDAKLRDQYVAKLLRAGKQVMIL